MLSVLEQDYVCTWGLPEVFEELAENPSSPPKMRAAAKEVFEKFRPLVEVVILTPEGTVLERREANAEILPGSHESEVEAEERFLEFLETHRGGSPL